MRAGITATRIRPGVRDRNGDIIPGTESEIELRNCGFDPGGSTETNTDGISVTTTPKLFSDNHDADVLADDEILVPGDPKRWYVDGDVARWRNPITARKAGCVISLTRTKGRS